MGLFAWSDKYSVGIPSIDAQHQHLVEMLNKIHEAMKVEKGEEALAEILAAAVKYAQVHFTYEEGLLAQAQYPELEHHKEFHIAFAKKAEALIEQLKEGKQVLTIETWKFLKSWLQEHIQGEDKKYTDYLKAKGIT
ncbi:bacteriohemerythrin [Bdellovibrionota bacterium FG-2]